MSTWKTKAKIGRLTIEEKEQHNNVKNNHKKEWIAEKSKFYKWKMIYDVERVSIQLEKQ